MPQPNRQILTVAEMVAAEEALMAQGISVDELMQRAGRGAGEWVWRLSAGRSVTVLCGPGNNGGDGYVISEFLREKGCEVRVIAPLGPKTDAAQNARAGFAGKRIEKYHGWHGGVFVDCLFGSGLARPLDGQSFELLKAMAKGHDHSVAIDLPSGMDADSGMMLNNGLPSYDLTVSLGAWKYAHWLMPGARMMGERRLVPIGAPDGLSDARVLARPRFSAPRSDAHKYTRGLLGVIGGAMPGASLLACRAAMHAGAGFVKLLGAGSSMTLPPDLVSDARPLDEALGDSRISALLVGQGLGRDDGAECNLAHVLERDRPTLVDADGLVLLAPEMMAARSEPVIATPHEGELAALASTFGIRQDSKLDRARALARQSGMTIVAKGPDTIIASPDGRLCLSPPSSSWLSTAGTGDVLAGVIASRLATGSAPFEAACEGVWLHGRAARLAGPAFSPGQLAEFLPAALAECL